MRCIKSRRKGAGEIGKEPLEVYYFNGEGVLGQIHRYGVISFHAFTYVK
jgi:hypothetical protein